MPKEILRSYLVASASGAHVASPSARPSGSSALLSCFTRPVTPNDAKKTLSREAIRALCSEESLQSWFDPLDIRLEADRVLVVFPHLFFSIRFFMLFQPFFESMARKLWGAQIVFSYEPDTRSRIDATARAFPIQTPVQKPLACPETSLTPFSDPTTGNSPSAAPDSPLGALARTQKPVDKSNPTLEATAGISTGEPVTYSQELDVQKQDYCVSAPCMQSSDTFRITGLHPAVGNPLPFGEEWTFDTFIFNGKHKWALGLTREMTRKAVYRVNRSQYYENSVQKDGDADETPGLLVLCGPHGTGKTHLLRAVGNELFRTLGNELFYASLSDLEMRFATESPLVVRQELVSKGAVLLDDFQHLARIPSSVACMAHYPPPVRTRPAVPENSSQPTPSACAIRSADLQPDPQADMQEELCLLLDRFMDQGKPVVIAGVGHPKDWNLGRALSSRLETGLWAELPEPDLDVRLRYAQQQSKFRRLSLPREHLLLLAQHCPDIRRLSGVIRRAASHRSLLGRDLSEQDLLNIIRQSGDSSALTPQLIVSIVGEHCGVPAKDILGEKRRPDLVQARQIAMYLCRELLGHSYPVIGRMFGGKDHSTVMHGVKKIKQLQERDRLTHTMVTELTKACLERRG